MDLNANLKGGWGCVGYAIGISILIFSLILAIVIIELLAEHGF